MVSESFRNIILSKLPLFSTRNSVMVCVPFILHLSMCWELWCCACTSCSRLCSSLSSGCTSVLLVHFPRAAQLQSWDEHLNSLVLPLFKKWRVSRNTFISWLRAITGIHALCCCGIFPITARCLQQSLSAACSHCPPWVLQSWWLSCGGKGTLHSWWQVPTVPLVAFSPFFSSSH